MKKFIVALIVLAAALGFYYWNQNKVTPSVSSFTDETLGISFDYDKENYVLLEQAPNESNPNLIKTIVLMEKADYQSLLNGEREGGEGPAVISLQVLNNPNNLGAREWVEQNPGLSNSPLIMGELTETNVSGKSGVAYNADGLYASRNVVFANGGKIYFASGQFLDRNSDLYREFGEFIKSLKLE